MAFADRLIAWFSGRRTRWVTVLIWVGLAVTAAVALPSVTAVESQNPANLPAAASSVVAARLQNTAFHAGRYTPGILVFYRRGGLTTADLTRIHAALTSLSQHPLPLQRGSVPFAGLSAGGLRALTTAHHTTLVVPLSFSNSTNSKLMAASLRDLGTSLKTSQGTDLLTVPTSSHQLLARLTGPEGIAIDTSGLFSNADVTLLAATTMIIVVLLLLIYRSPVLPWIPLMSVGLSYLVTSGILGLLVRQHAIVVDAETISIMTVLMFGAGTDYTLFVVSRYRNELWRESDTTTALRRAYRPVAGAVGTSAVTVMLAVLTLLVAVYGEDHRFAIPFAVGVGVTALTSLTLVPALLSLMGRPAFWPDVPSPRKVRPKPREAIASWVTRRPWVVLVVVTAILGGLAVNSTQIHTTSNLLSELPSTAQSVQGYKVLARAEGPGVLSPVSVVVEGPDADHSIRQALTEVPSVQAVAAPRHGLYDGRPVALYAVTLRQNPLSDAAMADVAAIQRAAARAVGPTTAVYLGGSTAQNAQTNTAINHDTLLVIPLVLALILALLMAYLRSLVAALYLIATVILSFFAALGAGWILLHNIMGIAGWANGVTLYAFVFLVALGEDYNIFMLSAIWGQRRREPMTAAIRWGIQQSGPVISAAGLILAGTFAVLTGLPLRILLEFGSVVAIGVLLDTFLVRSLLVPAITALLGDRALWPSRPPVIALGQVTGASRDDALVP